MLRRVILSSSFLPKFAAVGLMAGASAACSTDTLRFAEAPFSNPFSSSRIDESATGSLPQQQAPQVSNAAPLAPVQSSSLSAPQSIPAPAAASAPRPQMTARAPAASGPAGWSGQGGAQVTLAQGETVATLANRYGVPASAILAANGMSNASQAQPGQRLTIPVFNGSRGAVASAAPAPSQPMSPAPAPKLAPAKQVAMSARPQAAPAAQPQVMAAPKVATAQPVLAKPVEAKPALAPAKPIAKVEPAKVEPVQAAKAQPAPAVVAAAPAVKAVEPAPVAQKASLQTPAAPAAEASDQTASIARDGTEFRWPAKGRVIAGFNGKGGNEGINISLPEGTPVKAAEGGTVAYAGSELKGYGNLVLIRHDNGFVSAYAHNGELNVKRGEKVKRGQTIAKSGQTGNVSTPQLHFELRKGSTPVDPVQHLSGL